MSDEGPPDGEPGNAGTADDERTTGGAGGARIDADVDTEAVETGPTPLEAATEASGVRDRVAAWSGRLTTEERFVAAGVVGVVVVLSSLVLVGFFNPAYLLYLLALAGMYVTLTMGLNVQWGYSGLINFSVAAFFGVGAYGAALVTASSSPIAGGLPPLLGLAAGVAGAGVLAVLVGIPTLSLREDYLAIATLGLAEVVRLVMLNERQWTNGSAGLYGLPAFYVNWPVVGQFTGQFSRAVVNLAIVTTIVLVVWLFLRHVHLSPWGRVQRLVRTDEDLAEALGKDTYALRMQAFVIGSIVMALAGVFYAHLNLFVNPDLLSPIQTFYVWIAVIIGGTGSNRGAMVGGFLVIAIQEGTRFLGSAGGLNPGSLRLLFIGLLIIAIMRYRPEGVLPPQHELIWPGAEGGGPDE